MSTLNFWDDMLSDNPFLRKPGSWPLGDNDVAQEGGFRLGHSKRGLTCMAAVGLTAGLS